MDRDRVRHLIYHDVFLGLDIHQIFSATHGTVGLNTRRKLYDSVEAYSVAAKNAMLREIRARRLAARLDVSASEIRAKRPTARLRSQT